MTFGEMRKWTERFNQIIGAAQCLKGKRLNAFLKDLEQAYPNLQHVGARSLHSAVLEEMETSGQQKRHVG